MKLQEIILIFLLISYSFVATEDDICDTGFRNSLSSNCEAIISGKCKYDEDASSPCFSINNCGDADGKTQIDCEKIIYLSIILQAIYIYLLNQQQPPFLFETTESTSLLFTIFKVNFFFFA